MRFRVDARLGQLQGEAVARSVHAQLEHRARAVQYARDLLVAQAFPGHHAEQIAVFRAQPMPGRGQGSQVAGQRVVPAQIELPYLEGQAFDECVAASFTAMVVGQPAMGDAVEPEAALVARRAVVEAPSGGEERLRHDVGSVLGRQGPPNRVAEDAVVVVVKEGPELLFAARIGHGRPRLVAPRSYRTCPHGGMRFTMLMRTVASEMENVTPVKTEQKAYAVLRRLTLPALR